jgi:hypothetical protein
MRKIDMQLVVDGLQKSVPVRDNETGETLLSGRRNIGQQLITFSANREHSRSLRR